MLNVSKERRIANEIKKILNRKGFLVEIRTTRRTKSIYLVLDNGACDGIRISDHKNDATKYKFNMIKNYKGKKTEYKRGSIKKYYNFKNIGRLIADIEIERSDKIIKNGYYNYKKIRNKENISNLNLYKMVA